MIEFDIRRKYDIVSRLNFTRKTDWEEKESNCFLSFPFSATINMIDTVWNKSGERS